MLASGNSSVVACSFNLVNIAQREVPFSRSKGMDPDIYDMPYSQVNTYLDESARDVLDAYEDRIDVETVELEFTETDDIGGRFRVAIVESSLEEFDDDDEGDDD